MLHADGKFGGSEGDTARGGGHVPRGSFDCQTTKQFPEVNDQEGLAARRVGASAGARGTAPTWSNPLHALISEIRHSRMLSRSVKPSP